MLTGFICVLLFSVCGRCLAERCEQSEITQCMEHVQPMMRNATTGFAATAEQLDNVCRLFNQGMECLDRFASTCFRDSQRILFNANVAGVEEVMRRLCTDPEYRREYLRHAPCFRSVGPHYEECGKVFRTSVRMISENRPLDTQDKLSRMCGVLHRFLECGYNLTSQHCGTENGSNAANVCAHSRRGPLAR